MNRTALITSLLLKAYLLGNTAMAADGTMEQRHLMASLKASLPIVERSLQQYARAGNNNAQLALAKIYEAENNYNSGQIVKWYKKSAINGNTEAQFQLGLLYVDDELPGGDRDTGKYWIEKAAVQGHQRARMVFDSLELEDNSFGC